MRDTNRNMIKLIDCYKINDRCFGRVSIHLDNNDIKLKFGIDYDSYLGFKRVIQYRPFDNVTNQSYQHYFSGAYNRHTEEITVRVEQGNTHKQFKIKTTKSLIANLLWFQGIENISQVQHLLDLTDDLVFEEIKQFTSDKLGVDKETLNRQTMIEKDCGVSGLDTKTFYDNFFKKFNVQLPNGFPYDRFVESENFELFKFIKGLFLKTQKNKTIKIDLTLGELEQVALTGVWRDD
jgi:hypothetical protein